MIDSITTHLLQKPINVFLFGKPGRLGIGKRYGTQELKAFPRKSSTELAVLLYHTQQVTFYW